MDKRDLGIFSRKNLDRKFDRDYDNQPIMLILAAIRRR